MTVYLLTTKYLLTVVAQLISVNDSYATDTMHKMFDFCFVLYHSFQILCGEEQIFDEMM